MRWADAFGTHQDPSRGLNIVSWGRGVSYICGTCVAWRSKCCLICSDHSKGCRRFCLGDRGCPTSVALVSLGGASVAQLPWGLARSRGKPPWMHGETQRTGGRTAGLDGRHHGHTGERADIGMGRAGGRPGARRWTFWAAKQTPPHRGVGQPRGTTSASLKDVLKDVHFGHTLL